MGAIASDGRMKTGGEYQEIGSHLTLTNTLIANMESRGTYDQLIDAKSKNEILSSWNSSDRPVQKAIGIAVPLFKALKALGLIDQIRNSISYLKSNSAQITQNIDNEAITHAINVSQVLRPVRANKINGFNNFAGFGGDVFRQTLENPDNFYYTQELLDTSYLIIITN